MYLGVINLPRSARVKSHDGIYHVMLRSISDINLFKDDNDKDKFMMYIKRYKVQFGFKVYAYCLMSNHVHIIIDCNGGDISKIMHGINQSYAQYYNKKYNRYGHLFQDRFKSKIVDNERYLVVLSLYIHNNPKDIAEYKHNIENYFYSSLGIYLGIRKDTKNILDKKVMINIVSGNYKRFKIKYKLMLKMNVSETEFEDYDFTLQEGCYEYRSERSLICRDKSHLVILSILLKRFNLKRDALFLKNNREICEFKSIFILLCRNLCNMSYKELGKILINNSQANLSRLCSNGVELVMEDIRYKNIIENVYEQVC